jgi:DNA polymerase-3 subunit delta
MRQGDFANALTHNKLPHALMLFGEAHFMVDRLATLASKHFAQGADVYTLYGHDYSFEQSKAFLSQGSLFGGNNVLVVKTEKKIAKKELDELINITTKNSTTFFIYCYYGPDHTTCNTAFKKKNITEFVRLFNPFFGEAVAILTQRAQSLGVNIDNNTLIHLYKSQDENIALAYKELEKFAVFSDPIRPKDIDDLAYSLSEVKLDDTIAQLLEKKSYIAHIRKLRESGEEPVRIITAISNYISQLFLFTAYMRIHGKIDAKEILGYVPPKHVIDSKSNLAMRLKPAHYKAILSHLLHTELMLKQAKIDKDALLYAALLKLQSLL